MLKSITIQNYAIIDSLTIDFNEGFNVFTGETGAGKSIIIGALTMLSKGRSDTDIIKNGKDKAIIEGVFDLNNNQTVKNILNDNLIDYDDELIVRRTISKDGKSNIRINGVTVTLSFLCELLSPLIDIHSQKDNHYLFNKKNHIKLLDNYCGNNDLFNEYNELYKTYKEKEDAYNKLLNETYSESDLEFIKFQLNELKAAELIKGEEEDLIEKEKNYKLSAKYINNLGNSISLYKDNGGIKEKLYSLIKELDIDDETIQEKRKEIESLYYDLDDKLNSIEDFYSNFNGENINIEQIEERLYVYAKLKRKFHTDTDGLFKLIEELESKINLYNDREYVLNNALKELNEAKNNAFNFALKISELRKQKAKVLEEEIINQTKELLLPNVRFEINFINEEELSIDGVDNIEFYISLNNGEELKPLKNVASGGEISRIMLALKIIFAKLSDTKLVVFDEIDNGVSGKAAFAIGQKIKTLAKDLQVITITHLAPVAAFANNHYYIYKDSTEESTNTNVRLLSKEEIYKELAIISNGSSNNDSIEAAKNLYISAQAL